MSSTSPSVWPSPDATPTPPPSPTPPSNRAPRAAGRAAAGTLVAVALVGVLIGVGVDRVASTARVPGSLLPASILSSLPHTTTTTTTSSSGATAPAQPAAGGGSAPAASSNPAPATGSNPAPAASADPAQQAVQQVIQKGDTEQAQAVSSKDLSVMADTSTPDFLTQQQQATQDLLNNGVTSIDLSNIEWGPIAVTGTTATATNYETWTTTYSDGTTDQSRDRNDYTLVQQNGAWLVQSDVHPDDTAAAGAPGVAGQVPGGSNPFPGRGQGGSGSNPFANPGGANPGGANPGAANPGGTTSGGGGASHARHGQGGQGGNGGQPAGSGTNA